MPQYGEEVVMSKGRVVVQPDGSMHKRTLFGEDTIISRQEAEERLQDQGPSDGVVGDALVALGGLIGRAMGKRHSAEKPDAPSEIPGIIYQKKHGR